MAQSFVDSILSQGVFDVILFSAAVPIRVEFMNLTRCLSHLFDIEGFVNFTETSLPEKTQELILFYLYPVRNPCFWVDFSVF